MPRGSGTGPMGMGSMTGRGAGYCAGYEKPGYLNNILERGFGRGPGFWGRGGCGGGFGFRNRFYATGVPGRTYFGGGFAAPHNMNPEAEEHFLNHQAEILQKEIDTIKQRLAELSKHSQKK